MMGDRPGSSHHEWDIGLLQNFTLHPAEFSYNPRNGSSALLYPKRGHL